MPEVSVVVAAWNAESHIAATIAAILRQTFSDIELIVVDDGSTDGTADIVRGFQDPRVRLVRQSNSGQSAASNVGASLATGRFLKFVDADDLLNPDHINLQHQAIQQHPDHVASCRWGYFRQNPDLAVASDEAVCRDYSAGLEWLVDCLTLADGMMGAWLWLIPREVWDRCGGWCEELSLNNDFDLSIRLLLNCAGVRFAPEAVYFYRKGVSGSLSGVYSRKGLESALRTTQAGTGNLLKAEDSPRIRRICADRFQGWLFQFYPEHPDLAAIAEAAVAQLGGSKKQLGGGLGQKLLTPFIGWKLVRRLQVLAERCGWRRVQRWKHRRRLARIS
jgi:glycosyltransferase involved in cell wall biosynthesis